MSDLALPISIAPELPLAERLLSDERLARLASRGSTRAFAVLYERHHQAIYRYCRAIVRHDQDAQDALQNAMLRAFAALRGRERDLAVRPWLFRIAHNEAITILRKRRPQQAPSEEHESPGGDVEGTLQTRERLAALVRDLKALPERQRAALVMRELSGLSIAEIAAALSISQGAAKQTLFAARTSLQELAEGAAMECERVREIISHKDGRLLRGRRVGSHLRACDGCREFRAAIRARETDLRALAPPLPPVAAAALLSHVLAGGGSQASAATAAGSATGAGSAAGASSAGGAGSGLTLGGHTAAVLVKGIAGVAALAAATTGAVQLAAHHKGASTARTHHAAGTHPATSAPAVQAAGAHSRTAPAAHTHKHSHAKGGAAANAKNGAMHLSGANSSTAGQEGGSGAPAVGALPEHTGGRAYGRSHAHSHKPAPRAPRTPVRRRPAVRHHAPVRPPAHEAEGPKSPDTTAPDASTEASAPATSGPSGEPKSATSSPEK
jgi:RNA polymerase sigma factor (sigma-70 family)